MTTPSQPASSPATAVVRVSEDLREAAALRLVQSGGTPGTRSVRDARALLSSAQEQGFNFDHLWASVREQDSALSSVAWVVEGDGRTWMLFTTAPASEPEADDLGAVIARACAEIDRGGLAQALIDPGEDLARRAFLAGGFRELAELKYLRKRVRRHPSPDPAPIDWSAMGVQLMPMAQASDADLAQALLASYVDTLDCPGLSEMRPIEDVIASHRATGAFDPSWWWVIRDTQSNKPAGAFLLTPCPDQGTIELVYIGLAPSLRGRGIAGALLDMGETKMREHAEKTLACAVDDRNKPALKLYEARGFTGFARRAALVLQLGD